MAKTDLPSEDIARKPNLDEVLAPVRADFAATGMSEDELLSIMRAELEALRREKTASSPMD